MNSRRIAFVVNLTTTLLFVGSFVLTAIDEKYNVSILVSAALCFPAAGYYLLRFKLPSQILAVPESSVMDLTKTIANAPKVDSFWCSGQLGTVRFAGPLLRVELFASGLVFRPPMMPPIPLRFEDIVELRPSRKGSSAVLEVDHNSSSVRKPIRLVFYTQDQLLRFETSVASAAAG